MKKDGFISMTLVYTFLILFLFLMLAILTVYSQKNKFIDAINKQIDDDIGSSRTSKFVLLNKILSDNAATEDSKIKYYNISNIAKGNGNGLFYTETNTDENNDSNTNRIYFFRGEVNNNNVVFADMCFRIMRTNEDGNSIRLRYSGPYTEGKCPSVSDLLAGTSDSTIGIDSDYSEDTAAESIDYVSVNELGEIQHKSNIKDLLDNWYLENILDKENADNESYALYVTDTDFCSAKDIVSTSNNKNFYNAIFFVPSVSGDTVSIQNSFVCNNPNHIYNLSEYSGGGDRLGNHLLNYPVGLVTVADVVYAGGYLTGPTDTYNGGNGGIINEKYYMNIGKKYWTMSPYYYDASTSKAKMAVVNAQGTLVAADLDESLAIVPVISIRSDVSISGGIGTYNDPYIVR